MLTIRGVYNGKTFRVLPSEPVPIVDREVPVAITFLEGIVESKKRLEQTAIAKRMRAARGKMLPLGLRVKDLVEEGRER